MGLHHSLIDSPHYPARPWRGAAAPAAGYDTTQEEGVSLTQRTIWNKLGRGWDAKDDGASKTEFVKCEPSRQLKIYDDLIHSNVTNGVIGWLGWNRTNIGANGLSTQEYIVVSGRYGVLRFITSGTAGRGGVVSLGTVESYKPQVGTVCMLSVSLGLTNGTGKRWRFGLGDVTTDTVPNDGIFFEADVAVNANWRLRHRKAAADDGILDTGTAVAFDTYTRIMFVVESTTSIRAFINGTDVGAAAPAGLTTNTMFPWWYMLNVSATARCEWDYYGLFEVDLTAR